MRLLWMITVTLILLAAPKGEALRCYACAGDVYSDCYSLVREMNSMECWEGAVCVKYASDNHVERSCSKKTTIVGADICANVASKRCSTCDTDFCNEAERARALVFAPFLSFYALRCL